MKHFFLTRSLRVRLTLSTLTLLLPALLAVGGTLWLAPPMPAPLRGGLIGLGLAAILLAGMVYRILLRMILNPLLDGGQLLHRIAAGDLTSTIEVWTRDEIGQLFQSLKDTQDSLRTMIAMVLERTGHMIEGAREIAAGNQDLSARTEQQAAALQQTAASIEELACTTRQNADNARQANQLAEEASGVATDGGHTVDELVQTMDGISDSSRRIGEIVGVIDGIAFQTNILALNAAVEAARAGEEGRGFAVVAAEVRALAQRSAAAAREIKTLIEQSALRIDEGSARMQQAGQTMQEIVTAVRKVSGIMGEISAATVEQSAGIEQIHQAMSQIDAVTRHNARLVQQSARATGLQERMADEVKDSLAVFRLGEPVVERGTGYPALPATA
ncbi:methyl-accepting chemotaxis protein [Castellaniella defragrans]|uniref:Methyl-accepting chemotaxis protein I n=2 Tax=Castellaniella defragrans TaxID=75697 RepID=W8X8P5_CASD6|nr:methyl-accepting chemotaxis protein [Castellaniella defragrans]KAB0623855.1 HAMP domain-containing protein [Castellaniella defragrans]MBB6084855.1 methyl-accepting chemotaxis protein [Castellaniella defragrans]CDM23435.1 Methyl-accepting chemotaxis protein I [Castellaniella defragrans 65Phen]